MQLGTSAQALITTHSRIIDALQEIRRRSGQQPHSAVFQIRGLKKHLGPRRHSAHQTEQHAARQFRPLARQQPPALTPADGNKKGKPRNDQSSLSFSCLCSIFGNNAASGAKTGRVILAPHQQHRNKLGREIIILPVSAAGRGAVAGNNCPQLDAPHPRQRNGGEKA